MDKLRQQQELGRTYIPIYADENCFHQWPDSSSGELLSGHSFTLACVKCKMILTFDQNTEKNESCCNVQ